MTSVQLADLLERGMARALGLLLLCAALAHRSIAAPHTDAAGCSLYVSPEGSDASAFPSHPLTPFATLSRAADEVARISVSLLGAASSHSPTELAVCMLPGVYHETLTLSALHSAPGLTVTWRTLTPGTVRVSGGVDVSFQPLGPSDPARAYVPGKIADNVVVASLSAAGVTDFGDFVTRGGDSWPCNPGARWG